MLRRLHAEQPAAFAFTPANLAWAEGQISKYPEGRQASAIIPLLWRAQEQEGWLSRPAIEHVAGMLNLAYIRALEVATFYFMFQLQPVGSVAHIQICGTTSCMIMGAEDLVGICKSRIAAKAHTVSADGKFSWEEVECLGACTNAPMAQIGKDYYEDLTPEILTSLLDRFAKGEVPTPGPQNGRFSSEPKSGLTSLKVEPKDRMAHNGSVARALELGDSVKRIDGSEEPLVTPWRGKAAKASPAKAKTTEPKPAAARPADATGVTVQEAGAQSKAKPVSKADPASKEHTAASSADAKPVQARAAAAKAAPVAEVGAAAKPKMMKDARKGGADNLKEIKGIGPKLEVLCNSLGVFHFDQIASWTAAEVTWMDDNLEGFKGRVSRDAWVEQARVLSSGGDTEFSKRVTKGDVY